MVERRVKIESVRLNGAVCVTRTLLVKQFLATSSAFKKPDCVPPQRPYVGLLLLFFGAILATNSLRVHAQANAIGLTTSEAEALTTFEVKLDLSPTRPQIMTLEFGFGTDEPANLQGFFDSFSMTLQKDDASATGLFFTIDRTGIQLAPNNPGGLTLSSARWGLAAIPAGSLLGDYDYRVAYKLSFNVPAELSGANTLFFDVFSNQNGIGSAAYFRNLQLYPPPVVVQSTTLYNGIFTDEPDAYLDLVAMTADVPKIRPVQFFRVRGDVPVKLTLSAVRPDRLDFDFEFRPNRLVLMEATTVEGPYAQSGSQNFDLKNQTVIITNGIVRKFYRIESDVPVTVDSIDPQTGPANLHFSFQAGPMTLLISQVAGGPYVDSVDATFNAGARKATAPRMASRQTFRLSSEFGYRVKSIQDRGESWLLHIE